MSWQIFSTLEYGPTLRRRVVDGRAWWVRVSSAMWFLRRPTARALKRDLLDGICPEAVQLLKEKRACGGVFREMRRVKPMRQIEMAELMLAANNVSRRYAECLFAATPPEQLLEPDQLKDVRGLSPEDISRMEREMESLGQDYRLIEESHGRNVLNLVLVVGYLKKLLDNARVVRYLSQHHAEILAEFQKIVETKSLTPDG
jgi:hypothetical protein